MVRPASFGGNGLAGAYAGETKGQYFDYATQIIGHQCFDGSLPIAGQDGYFGCNAAPGRWNTYSGQSYALLVLQRSTGNLVQRCDTDGDGVVRQRNDNCPTRRNPARRTRDKDGIGDVCDAPPVLRATSTMTAR